MKEVIKGQAVRNFKVWRSDYTQERWGFILSNLITWMNAGVIEFVYIPKGDVTYYQIVTPVWIYEWLQHLINA